jgi:hypothetical protein
MGTDDHSRANENERDLFPDFYKVRSVRRSCIGIF